MPSADAMAVQLSPEECIFMGSLEESRDETDKAAILAVLTEEGQEAGHIAEAINLPASSVRKRLQCHRSRFQSESNIRCTTQS